MSLRWLGAVANLAPSIFIFNTFIFAPPEVLPLLRAARSRRQRRRQPHRVARRPGPDPEAGQRHQPRGQLPVGLRDLQRNRRPGAGSRQGRRKRESICITHPTNQHDIVICEQFKDPIEVA